MYIHHSNFAKKFQSIPKLDIIKYILYIYYLTDYKNTKLLQSYVCNVENVLLPLRHINNCEGVKNHIIKSFTMLDQGVVKDVNTLSQSIAVVIKVIGLICIGNEIIGKRVCHFYRFDCMLVPPCKIYTTAHSEFSTLKRLSIWV